MALEPGASVGIFIVKESPTAAPEHDRSPRWTAAGMELAAEEVVPSSHGTSKQAVGSLISTHKFQDKVLDSGDLR